jgi:pyridoxal biosynthesis lyase PdxS
MTKPTIVAAVGAFCLLGCAHTPAPTQQVAGSLAAVRAAEEAGAAEVPQAALHMKLAQEEIAEARKLMGEEKNAKAEDKAMRARNDAELALSLTHQQTASMKLDELQRARSSAGGEQPMTQGAAQ